MRVCEGDADSIQDMAAAVGRVDSEESSLTCSRERMG